MTLQELETKIDLCEHLQYRYLSDEDTWCDGVEAAVDGLYSVWGELRRTLWSEPFHGWANALKDRCREILIRLSNEHDLVYYGEPDRWPATATALAVH